MTKIDEIRLREILVGYFFGCSKNDRFYERV